MSDVLTAVEHSEEYTRRRRKKMDKDVQIMLVFIRILHPSTP